MKNTKTKNKKSGLRKLAENKGFYIALFSLVAVVGFYVYARYLQTSTDSDILSFDENAWQEAVAESGVEVIDVDLKDENKGEQNTETKVPAREEQKEKKEESSSKQETPETAESVVETTAVAEPEFAMMMPCQGQILAECSVEELVYCAAMDDWRTHNGMDIAAAEGDPVKAAESGVVSKVYEDDFLGVVVVIDHKDGISSTYANLQSLDFIGAGTKVNRGDIIGGVGKAGALEANSQPHLHFEVQANGEYKNPVEYIKN